MQLAPQLEVRRVHCPRVWVLLGKTFAEGQRRRFAKVRGLHFRSNETDDHRTSDRPSCRVDHHHDHRDWIRHWQLQGPGMRTRPSLSTFPKWPYTSCWAQVGTGQSDGVFVSSTRITATLPPGTGAALPVSVIYGTTETNKLTFSYGPCMHALHACPGFYCGSSSGSWSLL